MVLDESSTVFLLLVMPTTPVQALVNDIAIIGIKREILQTTTSGVSTALSSILQL